MKRNLKISKQQQILAGVAALGLVLGLIGYVALVAPQKSKAAHLQSEIAQDQASLVAAHAPRAKPGSVHATDLFRLTKAMPDTDDMPGILVDLTQVANASNVSVQSVQPSPETALTQGYAVLPVQVVVAGKFANVSGFLADLRKQVTTAPSLHVTGRLLVASEVQLSSSDGRIVTATLNLNAYVYGVTPPPAVAAGPTGAAATTTTTAETS